MWYRLVISQIQLLHFGSKNRKSSHGSAASFKKYDPLMPPAHKPHQTVNVDPFIKVSIDVRNHKTWLRNCYSILDGSQFVHNSISYTHLLWERSLQYFKTGNSSNFARSIFYLKRTVRLLKAFHILPQNTQQHLFDFNVKGAKQQITTSNKKKQQQKHLLQKITNKVQKVQLRTIALWKRQPFRRMISPLITWKWCDVTKP